MHNFVLSSYLYFLEKIRLCFDFEIFFMPQLKFVEKNLRFFRVLHFTGFGQKIRLHVSFPSQFRKLREVIVTPEKLKIFLISINYKYSSFRKSKHRKNYEILSLDFK